MSIYRNKFLFLQLLLFCFFTFMPTCESAIINAASASYSDVSAAILKANYGDTVRVPPGYSVWDTNITITKDIKLIGAGIDSTILKSNFGPGVHQVFFKFEPDAIARSRVRNLNGPGTIEIAGFTFIGDSPERIGGGNGTHDGVMISNTNDLAIRRIKIHHNKFKTMHRAIEIRGDVFGVVYENIFEGANLSYPLGRQQYSWNSLPYEYGTIDNLFFEDNTIIGHTFIGGGHGMRYLIRYNSGAGHGQPGWDVGMFDMHGNQDKGIRGTMITEVYGNDWSNHQNGAHNLDHRGGKLLFFFNRFTGPISSISLKHREEYCDSISPIEPNWPQHVNDTYVFNNRLNGVLQHSVITQNNCPEYIITMNVNVFNHEEIFDGKSGVGCGPITALPKTCTPGVAYWATDQSCKDLDGLVGKNPKTPISGTLYKCIALNTWIPYYTPYIYPHPLRQENINDNLPPAPPLGLKIVQ